MIGDAEKFPRRISIDETITRIESKTKHKTTAKRMSEEIVQHFLELGVNLSKEWAEEALKFLADNPESCTEGSQKEDVWKLFLFNDMTGSSRGTLSEALALEPNILRGLHVLQILEVINISSNLKEKAVCVLLPLPLLLPLLRPFTC